MLFKRKIDFFLKEWKSNKDKLPLIVNGPRQIGKTTSIMEFATNNYEKVVYINFHEHPEFKKIFDKGYAPEDIISMITLLDSNITFLPNKTLIFFDEIQEYPDCCTSFKFFSLDNKYDIIASGSLLGIHYKNIRSISVGFTSFFEMSSMDFEEYLWANNYNDKQIKDLLVSMENLKPLTNLEYSVFKSLFLVYTTIGGMPQIVKEFLETSKQFTNTFALQEDLYRVYAADTSKYSDGLDSSRISRVYLNMSSQLAKENKKFQITKLGHGARYRDYAGCAERLNEAGAALECFNLKTLELPLSGNYDSSSFKLYFPDTSFLIASLEPGAKKDLRVSQNFGVYKGAIYENMIAISLQKQGYPLYYYRNESKAYEVDFVIRNEDYVIPIEVKAKTNKFISLKAVVEKGIKNKTIEYGIKFGDTNIGFTNNIISFPYFLSFLLSRFLDNKRLIPHKKGD
jgi:uncharacterized protein